MKTCSKCKIEKELIDFHFRKDQNKHRMDCKECCRKRDNKRSIKIGKNTFKIVKEKELFKNGFKSCPKCNTIKKLDCFTNQKDKPTGKKSHCKNCVNIKRLNNLDKIYLNYKNYYQKNKIEIIKKNNLYSKKNRIKINQWHKNKRLIEPLFKLKCNIKSLILSSIKRKGYSKKTKTYQILGCSFEEFKQHLERQFTKGMTWKNQGEWHLDHIYPISLAKDEEEIIRLNHYTNFQPLWASDNIKKGNKIIDNTQLKLI
jgi:hypothetical protein